MFELFRRKNKAVDDFVSGTWKGRFAYGEGYKVERLQGLEVDFILKLHVRDKKVKGICIDEETKDLFPKPASVKGTFSKGQLEFVKLYPSMCIVEENGEVKAYPSLPPSAIHYYGKLDGESFQGHWVIPLTYTNEAGVQMNDWCKGTWYMTKEG